MHRMQANLSREREFILRLSCRDTKGIVHAVSGLLFQAGCNIIDSQQFGDIASPDGTGLFFMRVHFDKTFRNRLRLHGRSRRPSCKTPERA